MEDHIDLKERDLAGFEEKVFLIADEVLDILKELSRDNQKKISSSLLAEKMVLKESVKNVLNRHDDNVPNRENDRLRKMSDTILNKLTEIIPPHMMDKFYDMKDKLRKDNSATDPHCWLDSPISIIKRYMSTLSKRNKDLEVFLQQTMQYLSTIENHLNNEISSHHRKFSVDRDFEKDISTEFDTIKQTVKTAHDFRDIKTAVLHKIENINKHIAIKREQDMQRLEETEKTLQEMGKRMNEIKSEADSIRKKAQEVEYDSFHDALTGLYNRRAYEERVQETIANLQRYHVPASLMICDIDHFKKINDTFGHKVGDMALKKLAELLKERLRKNDIISRYGGEEFVVILPHTEPAGAVTAGEGIRSYIAQSVFSYNNQKIPLTISIGISSFTNHDTVDSVFERADQALYQAKNSGRNQVKISVSSTDTVSSTAP